MKSKVFWELSDTSYGVGDTFLQISRSISGVETLKFVDFVLQDLASLPRIFTNQKSPDG